jgi:hypothetical protein
MNYKINKIEEFMREYYQESGEKLTLGRILELLGNKYENIFYHIDNEEVFILDNFDIQKRQKLFNFYFNVNDREAEFRDQSDRDKILICKLFGGIYYGEI